METQARLVLRVRPALRDPKARRVLRVDRQYRCTRTAGSAGPDGRRARQGGPPRAPSARRSWAALRSRDLRAGRDALSRWLHDDRNHERGPQPGGRRWHFSRPALRPSERLGVFSPVDRWQPVYDINVLYCPITTFVSRSGAMIANLPDSLGNSSNDSGNPQECVPFVNTKTILFD